MILAGMLSTGLVGAVPAAAASKLPVSCVDKKGDAKAVRGAVVDLTGATVAASPKADPKSVSFSGLPADAGPGLRFTWRLSDYLDSNAKAVFRVTLLGAGGVRYVVAWDHTTKFGSTLVSDAKGRNFREASPGGGGLDMQKVEVDVPTKLMPKLRGSVSWTADVTVHGKVSDTCRNDSALSLPKR